MRTYSLETEADRSAGWSADRIAAFFTKEQQQLMAIVWPFCHDRALAKRAIFQAVGTLIMKCAETPLPFAHDYHVRWWLVRAARFAIINERIELCRWVAHDEMTDAPSAEAMPGGELCRGNVPSPDRMLIVRDFARVLEGLPVRDREILVRKLFDEDAKLTSTERSQLRRAKRQHRPAFEAADLLAPPAVTRLATKKSRQ